MSQEWSAIERSGVPRIEDVSASPELGEGLVRLVVKLYPDPPEKWSEIFANELSTLGDDAMDIMGSGILGADLQGLIRDSDLEDTIRKIDEAADAANARYEADVLPEVQRKREAREADKASKEQRQQALNDRAQALAKPDKSIRASRKW
ncbi:hypothetical protein P3H15_11265 [Rhodococcus sp. T2V]|uniref:hypothetical protein n=1 Tax=Rhodococcus sp. T2V TaxID=3034164 RepID=UPI0023E10494|nr:hypothetical protein [Rhodococcus sp. T2V]MDF3305599.1 hypothetical protein [Rhodococcus sp. T2V]